MIQLLEYPILPLLGLCCSFFQRGNLNQQRQCLCISQANTSLGDCSTDSVAVSAICANAACRDVSALGCSGGIYGGGGGGSSGDDTGALVGGIVGGCFVPVLMLILWFSGAFTKYGCKSPFAKPTPLRRRTVREA